MESKAFIILIVAMILVGLPSSLAVMNYVGICIPRMEYLSDEDKVGIAVAELLRNTRPSEMVYAERNGKTELLGSAAQSNFSYSGVEEFMEKNPKCCHVSMDLESLGHSPGVFNRLFGKFSGYVIIKYKANPGVSSDIKRAHVAVANCGRAWNGI